MVFEGECNRVSESHSEIQRENWLKCDVKGLDKRREGNGWKWQRKNVKIELRLFLKYLSIYKCWFVSGIRYTWFVPSYFTDFTIINWHVYIAWYNKLYSPIIDWCKLGCNNGWQTATSFLQLYLYSRFEEADILPLYPDVVSADIPVFPKISFPFSLKYRFIKCCSSMAFSLPLHFLFLFFRSKTETYRIKRRYKTNWNHMIIIIIIHRI